MVVKGSVVKVVSWSEIKLVGPVTFDKLNESKQQLTEVFTEVMDNEGDVTTEDLSSLTIVSAKIATYHCLGIKEVEESTYISSTYYYPDKVVVLTDNTGKCWVAEHEFERFC